MFTRFRLWLIHKLGGVEANKVVQPTVIKYDYPVQTVCVEKRIPNAFSQAFSAEKIPEEALKYDMAKELVNGLLPYMTFFEVKREGYKGAFNNFYRLELTVVDKQRERL